MPRCPLCPNRYKCIPPDGPPSAEVLFVGEAPGWDEEKQGRPFIGKTGREVNESYLPLAGLRRENVLFDNAISCLPDTPKHKLDLSKDAHKELLASCAGWHLYPHIKRVNPKLIVPMGAFACYALDPEIDLDMHHGMPFMSRFGWTFPMFHPAGGIHEPKRMLQIRTDWARLRRYLKGILYIPEDEYPEPDYAEVKSKREIELINPSMPLACDTESSRRQGPYCITYSQSPGTGRLIKADRPDLLSYFQDKLDRWSSVILFHNWLYDWTITEEMGLTFPEDKIRDTMVTAFHLGNVPQGLKALAYRLLGMKMQSFEDLVKPYSTVEVLRYYKLAQEYEWRKPEEQLLFDEKSAKWKLYKPQSMSTKLKRFFTDYGKNEEKDVFKMFEENWIDYQVAIEERCGPYPGMDIRHVPEDEALHYACRDSDATLRLGPIFKRMKEAAKQGKLQEQWGI